MADQDRCTTQTFIQHTVKLLGVWPECMYLHEGPFNIAANQTKQLQLNATRKPGMSWSYLSAAAILSCAATVLLGLGGSKSISSCLSR